ncbi:spermatogenesis-associated serine-rich protein 2-like isoform X2 [Biomphalaria glabrata]|uniref:Spermatogenesis-associated serine-rich protein 2-like isoform X2 n=1 Tax=Biomphalaria glabrata TaxID=6526 RepID=A0A9W2Z4G3_BIOGL|nr:spermatogenesis-associated serine-rich protein 2-like isoform X2 [Biomphalaria glabrata]
MARKNNSRSEASGSIHFDSRTKAVMAESSQDNIKEKVQAVREVVLHKSNNEVVMVLQYYDYNVERAIQAYLEDGAKEALQEWNVTGSKPKKRKNKKKAGSDKQGDKSGPAPPGAPTDVKGEPPMVNGKSVLPNGDVPNGGDKSDVESSTETQPKEEAQDSTQAAAAPTPSAATLTAPSKTATSVPQPQRQPHKGGRGHGDSHQQHHHSNRERTISEVSTNSGMGDGHHKKPFQGLEKAIKDLHRQTTSLERLKQLLDHEIDRSYKSMKSVFEELRQGLSNREAQLLSEMDILKKEASEMLSMRQGKAVELKRQVDRADKLKDSEVSELRAEIKHFVSERRHDEDIGHTTRFLFDSDHLLDEVKKFGEVVHVKSVYSPRRVSISSVASSSISHNDDQSQEVSELQEKFKNSLKLTNSDHQDTSSVDYPTSSAGTLTDTDFKTSKNRRRPASNRQEDSVSPSLDINSNKATTAAAPSTTSNSSNYSSQGSSATYRNSNTGSPGRGGRGGSNYGQRGGRGRGRGRGGYDRDGPRPQGQGYNRPYSGPPAAAGRPTAAPTST